MTSRFEPWLLGLVLLAGCAETPEAVTFGSLERSGKSAFVCVGPDGEPRGMDACPDYAGDENRLLALVTQTLRGEVAVVDVTEEEVLDADPASPGFSFLPVGANPVDIAATPGSAATFVAVAELGKEGIFALPTTCIDAPKPEEPARDLVLWPACALPAAPGAISVVVQQDAQPATTCDGEPLPPSQALCQADLSQEAGPPGRRLLAVTLPDLGQLAFIDAQWLLNQRSGSFEPCRFEGPPLALATTASGALPEQRVPEDLQVPATCSDPLDWGTAQPGPTRSSPSDLALADGRLYVADRGVPLVHVVDVTTACAARELPPLIARSFEDPERVVTTSRVAVSPLTSQGQRFLYAVDDTEGSLMVFDVSDGSPERAPLVREGTEWTPFEPADRIVFNSPARDVEFITHDIPIPDPTTGIAVSGTQCDPDPDSPLNEPPALHRTSGNRERGAGPRRLRGVFALVALASGRVVVVDVDDWDAACRRPVEGNPSPEPDFRGCRNDPEALYQLEGLPTVSAEATCKAVEPHRVRSASFVMSSSDAGVRAPSLRGFPRLDSVEGTLPSGLSEEGRENPRLMAVPFEAPHPRAQLEGTDEGRLCGEAWVGTTRYVAICDEEGQYRGGDLPINPAATEDNSVLLPLVDPRAYVGEDVAVSYEGPIMAPRESGFLEYAPDYFVLRDTEAEFCSRGVHDEALSAEQGEELGVEPDALPEFAQNHSDLVEITNDFLSEGDRYWLDAGAVCGGADAAERRGQCESFFGTPDEITSRRLLRVVEAYQDRLLVLPGDAPPAGVSAADYRALVQRNIQCCFPEGLEYRVRVQRQWAVRGSVSGFAHDVFADPADPGRRCRREPACHPRRKLLRGRAFELVNTSSSCRLEEGCNVGPARPEDSVCRAAFTADYPVVQPDGPGSECIFESLTARFALYRGQNPPQRDYTFSWRTQGGFTPLSVDIAAGQTTLVLPQSLNFVPQLNQVAVADGQSRGLVMIDLDNLRIDQSRF